ncbi:TetR/AcrR family transcriptional regulator [Rhodococcus koreensis]
MTKLALPSDVDADPVATDEASSSKKRIIEAATQLFVQVGYKGASLKAIAEAVGISPPALYWHFASKQELYLASMGSLLDQFVVSVSSKVTATDPRERLAQFVTAHVIWKLDQSEAAGTYTSSFGMRDLVHSLPPKHRLALINKQRQHLGLLRGILESGSRAGYFDIDDLRVTAFSILTMCEHVQSWFDPQGDLSPADVARYYASSVAKMVAAPASGK